MDPSRLRDAVPPSPPRGVSESGGMLSMVSSRPDVDSGAIVDDTDALPRAAQWPWPEEHVFQRYYDTRTSRVFFVHRGQPVLQCTFRPLLALDQPLISYFASYFQPPEHRVPPLRIRVLDAGCRRVGERRRLQTSRNAPKLRRDVRGCLGHHAGFSACKKQKKCSLPGSN